MISKKEFEKIFSQPSNNSILLMNSLNILRKYAFVQIKMKENGDVYYEVNIKPLLDSSISNEEIDNIHNGGWKIENNVLIKIL